MPFCQGCGQEVAPHNSYCLRCGRALAPMTSVGYPSAGYNPMGYAAPPVPNHLPMAICAIVVGFLCCVSLPLGGVAVYNAAQVDTRRAAGNLAGALSASQNARRWSIASFVVGGIGGVITVTLNAISFMEIFNSGPTP